jgi:hypothetical protein
MAGTPFNEIDRGHLIAALFPPPFVAEFRAEILIAALRLPQTCNLASIVALARLTGFNHRGIYWPPFASSRSESSTARLDAKQVASSTMDRCHLTKAFGLDMRRSSDLIRGPAHDVEAVVRIVISRDALNRTALEQVWPWRAMETVFSMSRLSPGGSDIVGPGAAKRAAMAKVPRAGFAGPACNFRLFAIVWAAIPLPIPRPSPQPHASFPLFSADLA